MGKGRQTQGDTTIRNTNLPEYADPYYRRLLQGAEDAMVPFDPVTGRSDTRHIRERLAERIRHVW